MKKLSILGCILFAGCDNYKVGLLDRPSVIQSCEELAECQMDQIDDDDSWDLYDEDVYQQYLLESCVDQWYDGLNAAKEFHCGAEYKAMQTCLSENAVNECDYDLTEPDDMEDYQNDLYEVYGERCWTVVSAYNECVPDRLGF